MTTQRQYLVGQLIERIADEPLTKRSELTELLRQQSPLLDDALVADSVDRALARATGLGPVSQLLDQPDLTDILINGPGVVWVEDSKGLYQTAVSVDREDIAVMIDRILQPLGLRVDQVSPMVDARLPDGSRVNIVVPPLAVGGPLVTIRRFATKAVRLEAFGPPSFVEALRRLVDERATILVVGGTGTGKTTLLNAIGAHVATNDRVVVVEDTAELRLPGDHIVRLEARPANSEGVGEVTLRQLVKNALRMRPDRLVIGEVRGGEALDLLLALNTGHRGSLATCHANSSEDGLRRLEMLCLMAGVELPLAAVQQQIGSAIDVIVHVVRSKGGERVVRSIDAVEAGATPSCRPLWVLDDSC